MKTDSPFLTGDKMKVMTFNIQHALDYKNQIINTGLFADAIAKHNIDFCGLNEVRGEGPVEDYTDQTNTIGDALGFYRYFGEAIKVRGTSPYGNAVVSNIPFKSVETIKIPDPDISNETNRDGEPVRYESRCIIKAVIEKRGKDICILVTHFGLAKSERINAVDKLCEIIDSTDLPLILMGDFNTEPDEELLTPLFSRLKSVDTYENTFPSYNPQIKIDYILYRELECGYSETINEIYADHLPIVAEFVI